MNANISVMFYFHLFGKKENEIWFILARCYDALGAPPKSSIPEPPEISLPRASQDPLAQGFLGYLCLGPPKIS